MAITRGGGNLRHSNRQAGRGVTPVVVKKISKKSKKKEVREVISFESDDQVVEEPMSTAVGGEEQSSVRDVEKPMSEGEKEDGQVEMDEAAAGKEDEPVMAEGEKEDEDEHVMAEGEKEDEELEVDSDKKQRGVDGENDQEPVEGGEQSQPAGGGEQSQPAGGETVDASTGGGSPQKSNSTTKRTRGQTKMRKVAKDPLAKNTSTNSGSSKGVKKKCILLDCKNPGKTVAEGRVCFH
ncbi:predicted protein [Arabidopsis lyrata subsp. lyrata]|uniref:Predicted protein n=1 Tax=Arabidopsis lyrata subsp. lyrata TaxID=81972 RepID=D7MWK5_ARALL|nr:predicted protein [Arabidopsis lyrata subsp. lyrata]